MQEVNRQNTVLNGAYLDGIAEGRSFLNANPSVKGDKTTMQMLMRNAQDCMRTHSGAMKDCFRGERDFWNNQIKKAG